MKEYLERSTAINRLQEIANDYEYGGDMDAFYVADYCLHHMIELKPAADVVEVRHGRWIRTDGIAHGIVSRVCSCSLCKRNAGVSENGFWYLSDYCPNCGAKMDGGADK